MADLVGHRLERLTFILVRSGCSGLERFLVYLMDNIQKSTDLQGRKGFAFDERET